MRELLASIYEILPPIRVHSWGGLGSQLFALNACFLIGEIYPSRKLVLCHHTGGVTKRPLELIFEGIDIETIDDFEQNHKTQKPTLSLGFQPMLSVLVRFTKSFLMILGILQTMNDKASLAATKPWVLQVRGHYTQLPITRKNLEMLRRLLFTMSARSRTLGRIDPCLCIHIRLGDLLTKKQSSLINANDLISVISRVSNSLDTMIFSDSNKEELQEFLGEFRSWDYVNESRVEVVISQCTACTIFVGSNSKISFWIAALRTLEVTESLSIVPKAIDMWLKQVIPIELVDNSKIQAF